ncbi:hypothetical protein ABZV65_30480 [Streptomyces bauhiniae]|uniref:hypothetical protein n=1 Tax=Streptomyces bauhiniae TaxID=2340725 RepID=UPI00339F669A
MTVTLGQAPGRNFFVLADPENRWTPSTDTGTPTLLAVELAASHPVEAAFQYKEFERQRDELPGLVCFIVPAIGPRHASYIARHALAANH